jgi:hypothetical protein
MGLKRPMADIFFLFTDYHHRPGFPLLMQEMYHILCDVPDDAIRSYSAISITPTSPIAIESLARRYLFRCCTHTSSCWLVPMRAGDGNPHGLRDSTPSGAVNNYEYDHFYVASGAQANLRRVLSSPLRFQDKIDQNRRDRVGFAHFATR